MKKTISVILSLVMLLSVLPIFAYAAEEKYYISFSPFKDVSLVFAEDDEGVVDEDGVRLYAAGAKAHFDVVADEGYEKTESFMLTANGSILEANEDGTYTIAMHGNIILKLTPGSVMKKKVNGFLGMLFFWLKVIFDYLRRIFSFNKTPEVTA